jgi:hypothetical protein
LINLVRHYLISIIPFARVNIRFCKYIAQYNISIFSIIIIFYSLYIIIRYNCVLNYT